jgi:hypothetical protein
VDKIVYRLRTESEFYRRVSAWDDFMRDTLQADFPPAGPGFGSGRRSIHSDLGLVV